MLIWTLAIVFFIILEASTAQFVSIWFAGGSFMALIASLFKFSLSVQILAFVLGSGLLLIFTKKFVNRLKSKTNIKTNSDSLIGQVGVVTESISNLDSKGAVKVRGVEWSARSEDNTEIKEGAHVIIEKIEGVKLITKEI